MITEILEKRFAEVLQPKFDPKELRLSEVGACPRMQVLRALGYTGHQNKEVAGLFESGHVWEEWAVNLLRRRFADGMPGRPGDPQQVVIAPYGAVGHIDFWSPSEKLIVECKCVRIGAKSMGLPKKENIKQVQAYLHYFRPDARAEILYVFREDPRQSVAYPVRYNPGIGREIEAHLKRLRESIDAGEIPERPYGSPMTFPCFYSTKDYDVYCPFHVKCWEDFQGPEVGTLDPEDPEAGRKVEEYLAVLAQRKDLQEMMNALDDNKKGMERAIGHYMPAGEEKARLAYGGTILTRTMVNTTTYDVKKAIQAGAISAEAVEPFKKPSSYYRWTVSRDKI